MMVDIGTPAYVGSSPALQEDVTNLVTYYELTNATKTNNQSHNENIIEKT